MLPPSAQNLHIIIPDPPPHHWGLRSVSSRRCSPVQICNTWREGSPGDEGGRVTTAHQSHAAAHKPTCLFHVRAGSHSGCSLAPERAHCLIPSLLGGAPNQQRNAMQRDASPPSQPCRLQRPQTVASSPSPALLGLLETPPAGPIRVRRCAQTGQAAHLPAGAAEAAASRRRSPPDRLCSGRRQLLLLLLPP